MKQFSKNKRESKKVSKNKRESKKVLKKPLTKTKSLTTQKQKEASIIKKIDVSDCFSLLEKNPKGFLASLRSIKTDAQARALFFSDTILLKKWLSLVPDLAVTRSDDHINLYRRLILYIYDHFLFPFSSLEKSHVFQKIIDELINIQRLLHFSSFPKKFPIEMYNPETGTLFGPHDFFEIVENQKNEKALLSQSIYPFRVYHLTSASNIYGILQNGFQLGFATRQKNDRSPFFHFSSKPNNANINAENYDVRLTCILLIKNPCPGKILSEKRTSLLHKYALKKYKKTWDELESETQTAFYQSKENKQCNDEFYRWFVSQGYDSFIDEPSDMWVKDSENIKIVDFVLL